MSALTYARYDHDAYTRPEPDYSGLECTVPVYDAPLRLYGSTGPVLAFLDGKVEIKGEACAGYSVGTVTWFDAEDNARILNPLVPGSMEDLVNTALINAVDEDALEALRRMARGH